MNFGFLLFENLEELDLVGPWEMISIWSYCIKILVLRLLGQSRPVNSSPSF